MFFFYNSRYKLTSNEIKHVIPEFDKIVKYNTLEEYIEAVKKPDAVSYDTDAIGNDLNNSIIGSSIKNFIDGGAGQDTLEGRDGDDSLWGGLGADILIGGTGNDSYNVDNAGDKIVETANNGIEFVMSTVTYTLPDHVENLGLGGSGRTVFDSYEKINGTGNALDNELEGNAGNNHLMGLGGDDKLSGGKGLDTLEGGTGDDSYYVESADSIIVEEANGGNDTASIMYHVANLSTFDFGKVKNIEVLHLANYGSGQSFAAATSEFFLLDDKLNRKNTANLDDFEVQEDMIGLSKSVFSKIAKKGDLKKSAFWTGAEAHDQNDRIIYNKKVGDLYYDSDGSGSGKAIKIADTDKNLKMKASDFFVI